MNNAHARLVPGKRDHDYSIREVKRGKPLSSLIEREREREREK